MAKIAKCLEKILGETRFDKLKKSSKYKYAVDTGARIALSLPVAMANEIFVAGMDVSESIKARLVATVSNLFTARPYGKYRDWVFKKCEINNDSGRIKKFATDVAAFSTFQLPIYAGILYACGADAEGVAKGSAVAALLAGAAGRPYGIYLDIVRDQFGVPSPYKQQNPKLDKDGLLDKSVLEE